VGWLKVVGVGPGNLLDMTLRARLILEEAEVVVGYRRYVEWVLPLVNEGAIVVSGEMGGEVERAREAIKRALEGQKVCVVSGGDAGIYGMAGLVLELLVREGSQVGVEIVPGVSAVQAVAALLGAPLMQDFAVVSLSDLLVPWEVIARRLEAAAWGDFVLVLCNPASTQRKDTVMKAVQILEHYRSPETVVGLVRAAGQRGERVILTTLARLLEHPVDMLTTIVVGSSKTLHREGWMITPRGYRW